MAESVLRSPIGTGEHAAAGATGASALRALLGVRRSAGLAAEIAAVGTAALAAAGLLGSSAGLWLWTGAWLLVRLGHGTGTGPMRGAQLVSVPLRTGLITVLIAVASALIAPPLLGDADLLALIGALSLTALAARVALFHLHRPRVVTLRPYAAGPSAASTAVPGSTPVPGGELLLSHQILTDPAALCRAVLLAVEDAEAEVVDVCPGASDAALEQLAWQLRSRGVSMRLPLGLTGVRGSKLSADLSAGDAALLCEPSTAVMRMRVLKRLGDVIGAAAILLVLSPLLIAAAVIVRLDSPGPILFRQIRVGIDGREFAILKFRTMVRDADAQLAALLAAQNRGDAPLFKVADDPRITRVGGFMRRYSIDELPQLFNVLGGSMSLVGPRPQRPAEVALYTGLAGQRLGVRPGMTGLWQVSGRSNLAWERAQQLDVYYVHNWSPAMDLCILLRTARAVLASDGAV